ncbi:anhydro-N-acetylmuramic acid kinase [Sediminicola luteus]|uniref:Anhydro-N-acetylmuramic acid kinase n=1 Tax=Sediminicola luteus TaxID=319238 RepID=A0A2A4G8R4_9FLAO|nr:anhydro-N-acetylmuramic acid kinase [Sediminicola luteus]PCE64823.1 anhydro-N-acetylmuramic acid kinase [Sediminicola luteus]
MKSIQILGLMSGTSLDGLDMALCEFRKEGDQWSYTLGPCQSISYDSGWQKKLAEAINYSALELGVLHNKYGTWLGEQVQNFKNQNTLKIDYVASHGHTIHHRPDLGYTCQIGSGQHLANACHLPTISDFRTQDVALGGQGAPLVPIGDRLLFEEHSFCLNLGGISNVSFEKNGERIAYDIGLANMPLNYLSRKIGLEYDKDGQLARQGKVIPALLEQLNALAYYQLPYPKSTGYEWFETEVIPLLENTEHSTEDLLHTCIAHITDQLAIDINTQATEAHHSLLVTGGGALNGYLMEALANKLNKNIQLSQASLETIEYKEALIFAFMGALRLQNSPNCLSSVTGAKTDAIGGVLHWPNF